MGQIGEFLGKRDHPEVRKGRLPVGSMASGSTVALPYVAVRGRYPGKTLWLNGQVHGDEINGMLAALQFARALNPDSLYGNVVVTPTANPQSLDSRRKRNPFDELDLDQTFPGSAKGLISERLAHALISEIRDVADMVVSLHTMNPLFDSKAYAVYKVHPESGVSELDLLRAISLVTPNVACRQDVGGMGELPGNVAGGIDYQCLAARIPAFMIELGSGSRYQAENVRLAENAFMMLARHLAIVRDGVPVAYGDRVRRVTRRNWLTFDHGGLFVPVVEAGATLERGCALGHTMDLYGDRCETVSVSQPGIVIGLRSDPVVHTGERAAFYATEWDNYKLVRP